MLLYSLTVLNLQIKLYHRCVRIGQNIDYIGLGTILGFRLPLGVLGHVLWAGGNAVGGSASV